MKKTIAAIAIALFASCKEDPGDGVIALPDPPAPSYKEEWIPYPMLGLPQYQDAEVLAVAGIQVLVLVET